MTRILGSSFEMNINSHLIVFLEPALGSCFDRLCKRSHGFGCVNKFVASILVHLLIQILRRDGKILMPDRSKKTYYVHNGTSLQLKNTSNRD